MVLQTGAPAAVCHSQLCINVLTHTGLNVTKVGRAILTNLSSTLQTTTDFPRHHVQGIRRPPTQLLTTDRHQRNREFALITLSVSDPGTKDKRGNLKISVTSADRRGGKGSPPRFELRSQIWDALWPPSEEARQSPRQPFALASLSFSLSHLTGVPTYLEFTMNHPSAIEHAESLIDDVQWVLPRLPDLPGLRASTTPLDVG